MVEKVQTYLLDETENLLPMDRTAFYDEQRAAKQPTRAVDIVDILIFNEHGELFLQKRSTRKQHNPGLIDKSIGGHISLGDSPDYTVMVETVQELQVPSIVLRSDPDFLKTLRLLRQYIDTVCLIKHIDTKILHLGKRFGAKRHVIANRVHLYFGLYGGRVKTVDREAQGVLTYDLEQLQSELVQFPDLFTDDLKIFLKQYGPQIQSFRSLITQAS